MAGSKWKADAIYVFHGTFLRRSTAFAADPLAKEVFPEGFVSEYCAMKEKEWNEYHEIVSDWELSRYLTEL